MSTVRKMGKVLKILVAWDYRWYRALRYMVAPSPEHLLVFLRIAPEMVVDIDTNHGQFALVVRHC